MTSRFRPLRGSLWWGLLLAAVVASLLPARAFAQSEDGLKAAFIYNFAKFVEWPPDAFSDANAPITVGFVNADSLAALFEKNVTGKTANGRDYLVKRLRGPDGADSCAMVFVGDPSQAAAVLGTLKGKPILTVGSSDAFAAGGGMINFIKDGAKMTFDLNLSALTASNLKLDPKLRQLARNGQGD